MTPSSIICKFLRILKERGQ